MNHTAQMLMPVFHVFLFIVIHALRAERRARRRGARMQISRR
jgi:hypothetical protein